MITYNKTFENKDEMKDFILLCEENYKGQVINAARAIAEDSKVKFVMLSGPSCSGKTTTASILFKELANYGKRAEVISIDDFYRDRIKDEAKPDFETAAAIDVDYFGECVEKLTSGREALLPIFDFNTESRSGYRPHVLEENEIIVFEGIQALYPEILTHIPSGKRKSIYISVSDDVSAYGAYFSARDVRFVRRIVRDFWARSSSVKRTLDLWGDVVANEEKSIIPAGKKADFIINSLMLYEFNVMKKYIFDAVKYDLSDPEELKTYNDFKLKFENIPEIPSALVPSDSVFREFIGKE